MQHLPGVLSAKSQSLAGLLSHTETGPAGTGLYLCLHQGCILPCELLLSSSRDEDVKGQLQDVAIIGLCFWEANYGSVALK